MSSRLVSCLMLFLPSLSLVDARDAGDEYLALRQQIGRGKYIEAVGECKVLIRKYPNFAFFYETLPEVAAYAGRSSEAIEFFYERIEDGTQLPLVYYGLGTSYYMAKDYRGAVACFGYSIESGCTLADCYRAYEYAYEKLEGAEAAIAFFNGLCRKNTQNGNYWYALAMAYWAKKDLRNALRSTEQAIEQLGTDRRFLQARAALLYLLDQNEHAIPLIETLLQRAKSEHDFGGGAFLRSHLILGIPFRDRHDLILLHTKAIIDIGTTFGFLRWRGWGHKLLSDIQQAEGNLEEARTEAEVSIAAATSANDDDLRFSGMQRLFDVLSEKGQYYSALENACDRLVLAKSLGEELRITRALGDIAWTLQNVGARDLALSFAIEAQNRALVFEGNFQLSSSIDLVLGSIYEGLGNYPEALKSYRHALTSYPQEGDWVQLLLIRNDRFGRVLSKMGKYIEAEKFLIQQLAWQRQHGYPKELSASELNLGLIYSETRQFEKARTYLNEAFSQAKIYGQQPIILAAARELSKLEARNGHMSSALTYLELCIETANVMGLWGERLSSGTGPHAELIDDCEEAVGLLEGLHRSRDALAVSERLKMLSSQKDIGLPIDNLLSSPESPVLGRLESLRNEWIALHRNTIEKQRGSSLRATQIEKLLLQASVIKTELAFSRVLDSALVDQQHTHGGLSRIDNDFSRLIGAGFPASTSILEYAVGPRSTVCFVITKEGLNSFSINVTRDSLRRVIRRMSSVFNPVDTRSQPSNSTMANFSRLGLKKGFELLFRPAKPFLRGVKHIKIIVEDELRNLPFEILIDSLARDSSDLERNNEHYVLEDYEISYSPTITQAVSNPGLETAKTKVLLAVGNAFVAPNTVASQYIIHQDMATRFGMNIPRYFPGVQQELDFLKGWIPGRIDVLSRLSPEGKSFLDLAQDYSVLHLSTHFSPDCEQPLYSMMELSTDSSLFGKTELRVLDLVPLRLNAELVVLSGCNTARSSGLTYADAFANTFLNTGVRSVIGSLWAVDDIATAFLMQQFYVHLEKGERKTLALRNAKLEVIRSGRGDPYYWAGFVLLGSDNAMTFPQGDDFTQWRLSAYVGSFAICFVVALLLFRDRGRGRLAKSNTD